MALRRLDWSGLDSFGSGTSMAIVEDPIFIFLVNKRNGVGRVL